MIGLKDYDPKGTPEQEAAFEEWYLKPEASEGFCRKTAFIRGWEAAVFEMGRELDRLRADNRALRDVARMPAIGDTNEWEGFMDALAAEIEAFGAETAALHYASAVANWDEAMRQRDLAVAKNDGSTDVEIDVEIEG